ncbi:collectin-12-like [Melanotaenia boesemani]|uniref:collectin-12-like n=1 Tax=Melanotaenia boesemani TaxID=1250792 RepID=UPI001C04764F|nr:collectin-12-like [Melanotaenia boesemani]
MPEAEVTYADVKFTRRQPNDNFPSSDDTTYSEVKILRTELPVCANCSQQQVGPNRKCHVTSERAALLVLSLLLVAAVITLGVTGLNREGIQENTSEYKHELKEENEALRKNLSVYKSGRTIQTCPPSPTCPLSPTCPPPSTCPPPPACPRPSTSPPPGLNLNEKRLKCEAGWEPHGEKCYYFTTTKSSWNNSRDGCKLKGGDLVKIDSREEQIFLEARLREKMEEAEDKFWIGLTDSAVEGRWLWVDGSFLDTRLKFWSINEPDNWKGGNPDGEDCVRMGEKGGAADLKCWFDRVCIDPHKSICEKAAETRGI